MTSLLVEMPLMAGPQKGNVLMMPCGPKSTFGDVQAFLKAKLGKANLSVFVKERGVLMLNDDLFPKTLREFMCLASPIPVYFHDGESFQINVITLTGKKVPLIVHKSFSILDVKKSVLEKEGIPLDHQRLIFAGHKLEDDRRICHYDIHHGCSLHLVLRLRGGGHSPLQSLSLVDVSKDEARIDHAWSESAPEWRKANKGFSIEGECVNIDCRAFGKFVICNMQFGCFNLATVVPSCPMCKNKVESENLGFNNCFYRIRGVKEGSHVEISIPWTKVGDCYRTWDEDRAGIVEWEHMEVIVRSVMLAKQVPGPIEREAPIAEDCAICFQPLYHTKDTHMLRCCHSYHSNCWKEWSGIASSKGCDVTCPLCRLTVETL